MIAPTPASSAGERPTAEDLRRTTADIVDSAAGNRRDLGSLRECHRWLGLGIGPILVICSGYVYLLLT